LQRRQRADDSFGARIARVSDPEDDKDTEAPSAGELAKQPATKPADHIALPRTMSEEWMAADVDDGAYEVEAKRPRWLIPTVAGGIVTIAIVALFALRDRDDGAPARPQRVAVVADGRVPPTAVVVDAPVIVETAPPPDAREPDVSIDAAVAVAPPDAAVRKPPSDAAIRAQPAPPPPPPPPHADERTIEQLVDAGEFAKANTQCRTNTHFTTPRLVACAIAACQSHDAQLAARWARALPSASHDEIAAKCKALGVEVDPKSP
jgi:hypothetical protein